MTVGLALGLDVGTSGVRGIVVDAAATVVGEAAAPLPEPERQAGGGAIQDPRVWVEAMQRVVAALPRRREVRALAIDGTSGTLLVTDADGRPLAPARLYNDASAADRAAAIKDVAPPESGAHGATSPLARLLDMQAERPDAVYALHQADWLAGRLTGRFGLSDDNNALKLGWDPVRRCWPDWMETLGVRRNLLPEVIAPGDPLGRIDPRQAAELDLDPETLVIAGTTDGCASFLATGATAFGEGVTALGSTLTIKLLSDHPIFAPQFGVYSHRLGPRWLVGGASNSGGGALLRFFTPETMAELEPRLDPDHPTGRHWHPLPGTGERFPIADPALVFEPEDRPADDAVFFQALLEGIADVEASAYAKLAELGASRLRSVRTVGGGAANRAWSRIRGKRLGVPMESALNTEAAYGTARLALEGLAR